MKKAFFGLISALVLLIGTGAGLLAWILRANDNFVQEVTLKKGDITTQELSFSASEIHPGGGCEYTVNVKGESGGEFAMTLTCSNEGKGELWKYLNIEVQSGESKVETTLASLFGGEALNFDLTLTEESPASFLIRYTMPLDVGNEAQGETADFVLLLTAKRK